MADRSRKAIGAPPELATRYDTHAIVYRGGLFVAAVLLWLTVT
jgi:hypothetical protein